MDMNLPKHCSPAPWITRDNGQTIIIESAEEQSVNGMARYLVATTSWHRTYTAGKSKGGIVLPEKRTAADWQKANAALMRAAPELYDFVHRIANDRDDCVSPGLIAKAQELLKLCQPNP